MINANFISVLGRRVFFQVTECILLSALLELQRINGFSPAKVRQLQINFVAQLADQLVDLDGSLGPDIVS